MANILLGSIIFGYAAFALYKHIHRSKQGKCTACAIKNACKKEDVCASSVTNKK